MRRSTSIRLAVFATLVAALLALLAGIASRESPTRGPAGLDRLAVGSELDKPVPAFPLVDERGRRTSLASFRGRYLLLTPSLTLCHEVCPMTTAALLQIQRSLDRDGLGDQVSVAEISVDPWRDSPARLRAYRRLAGVRFRMLTGSQSEIRRLWKFFGVAYRRVPQDRPPDKDWWTGKPETFDVEHTDGLFILDPRGHLRAFNVGMPSIAGQLPGRLHRLLNEQGNHNLRYPDRPWTAGQALQDLLYIRQRDDASTPTPPSEDPPSQSAARAQLAGSPPALAALHTQAGALLGGGAKAFSARLAKLRGRPVVINAWASWCFPCRNELPLFATASARFGKRVAFLGLNVSDHDGSANGFLRRHPVSYPSYADPDSAIMNSFATAEALPTTIYLAPNGKKTYIHIGTYTSRDALDSDIQRYALGN
jgi:cytochrome oxidase Cu insertion factor (SCO1/SenC/PrrC family)/thiol-disulfide isomerase/thioredoxin